MKKRKNSNGKVIFHTFSLRGGKTYGKSSRRNVQCMENRGKTEKVSGGPGLGRGETEGKERERYERAEEIFDKQCREIRDLKVDLGY